MPLYICLIWTFNMNKIMMHSLLWLDSFTQHNAFKVYLFCSSYQLIHSFYCQITFHYVDVHFPEGKWWTSFQVLIGHLHIFFGQMSIQILCAFLTLGDLFLIELQKFLIYFIYKYIYLIKYMICKYFLLFCELSFHFLDDVLRN